MSRAGGPEPENSWSLIDRFEALIWIVGIVCATVLIGLWLLLSYGWRP